MTPVLAGDRTNGRFNEETRPTITVAYKIYYFNENRSAYTIVYETISLRQVPGQSQSIQ